MAKKKNKSKKKPQSTPKSSTKTKKVNTPSASPTLQDDYLWSMSDAPSPGQSVNWFQLLPAAFFTAFVIMIVRLYNYTRDMGEYYWSAGSENLVDFFSHYKVVGIIVCALVALILLLYRLFTQSFYIKRSILYIPALVYLAFVLLSYAFSSVKDIAWMGWNDRFEGTLILMCYIFMAFYIMNIVNSEKNVKMIIYPLGVSSFLLSLLGISQAIDKDFFRTAFGQKLIVPNSPLKDGGTAWQAIDQAAAKGEQFLQFTFQNKEIYQTVYNINYVSFYLTLLIPIFGLLFIQEKQSIVKKIIWGLLFAVNVFNLIGSASSGGILGMFVIVVLAIVMFNKKVISWWKPLVILMAIVIAIGGITFERWSPELSGAISSAVGSAKESSSPASGTGGKASTAEDDVSTGSTDNAPTTSSEAGTSTGEATQSIASAAESVTKAGDSGHVFDYFANKGNTIELSLDGNIAIIDMTQDNQITMTNKDGKPIDIKQTPGAGSIVIEDDKFKDMTLTPTEDEEGKKILSIRLNGEDQAWNFTKTDNGVMMVNSFGNTVKMEKIPHWGFKDNPGFGSGRGYIWSTSLPMIKDTAILGHGADTYCVYYPHKDYVGKYNAKWNINMVVDKPHNMYIGIAVNTGLISLLALLAFFGMYIVQSFRLYFRHEMKSFVSFAGAGIFLGICGFLVSGIVNDSSVSVMPMLYGLLGTGIAINMMIKKNIE